MHAGEIDISHPKVDRIAQSVGFNLQKYRDLLSAFEHYARHNKNSLSDLAHKTVKPVHKHPNEMDMITVQYDYHEHVARIVSVDAIIEELGDDVHEAIKAAKSFGKLLNSSAGQAFYAEVVGGLQSGETGRRAQKAGDRARETELAGIDELTDAREELEESIDKFQHLFNDAILEDQDAMQFMIVFPDPTTRPKEIDAVHKDMRNLHRYRQEIINNGGPMVRFATRLGQV